MAGDSSRRGGLSIGTLIVAAIFLGLLGGGVGYSLGVLSKHQRAAATPPPARDVVGQTADGTRCPEHTETLAKVAPLFVRLHIRTAESEVWICADAKNTLFYQGHSGPDDGQFIEGTNALYLTWVKPEGADGYVARNPDPKTGGVTEYHVTPGQLRIVYPSGTDEVQPATG